MAAALGLPSLGPAVLPELLQQEVRSAAWAVLLGPLPLGQELTWINAAGGSGPLLVVEPNPLLLEQLLSDLTAADLAPFSLVSELVAATVGEQCWYRYNDPRHSGVLPPEQLRQRLPNLELESLELRPTLPLASVLDSWREQRLAHGAPWPEGEGLLLLPAAAGPALLAGAGPWLDQLAVVLVHGPRSEHHAALEALLAAACLCLETNSPDLQLWRLSPTLRLEQQLQEHVAERDQLRQQQGVLQAERDQLLGERDQLRQEQAALQAERDQLVGQKGELEQRLELINRELDEILLLLDSAEMAPPAAGPPSEPQLS